MDLKLEGSSVRHILNCGRASFRELKFLNAVQHMQEMVSRNRRPYNWRNTEMHSLKESNQKPTEGFLT